MVDAIKVAALLGSLDSKEFRPRPFAVSSTAIEFALEKGWIERQTSEPGFGGPHQYRLTPRGERAVEFYIR